MQDRADERARLNAALEHANARLSTLESELEQQKQRISRLRADLAALDTEMMVDALPVDETARIRAPAEKLSIFRSLFRGRPDLYPTRFVGREGKQGYGPACANKFVKGTCELPRVKCGECKNQAFLPADDAAYFAHLRGDHVMGVYPMLQDLSPSRVAVHSRTIAVRQRCARLVFLLGAGRGVGGTQARLLRAD